MEELKMRHLARNYYLQIEQLLKSVLVADSEQNEFDFCDGIARAVELIALQTDADGKLMFIGNGASAAISSHQATDFWKNGQIKAIAFNDVSGLTCISNDFGYEYVFEKPIEMFAEPMDVLVAISSSGQSENILRGVAAARRKGAKVITLSGFDRTNSLRLLGDINFYVPSSHYGHVEVVHLSICHCLLDIIIQKKSRMTKYAVGDVASRNKHLIIETVD
jgi:D-sedoheptulose 7-phosphate isomerase